MLQDAQCTIRLARADDLPAVVEAYNAGIADRVATFETKLRTVTDVAGWLEDGQPFIVADRDARVLGWARAGPYSDCCVHQGVGEHVVYVHPKARARASGAGCSPR
jgi:L-amino acid N-acyltransferase YncA